MSAAIDLALLCACGRPVYIKKTQECVACYQRRRAAEKRPPKPQVPEGMKRCPRCGETKPLDAFHRNVTTKDGLQSHCRKCKAADQAEKKALKPKPAPKPKPLCACGKPVYAKGECSACYQNRRYREKHPPRPELPEGALCACGGPIKVKSTQECERCYNERRRAEQMLLGILCIFPDCGEPSHTRGWCVSHYSQWQKTGKLRPLKKGKRKKGEPLFVTSRVGSCAWAVKSGFRSPRSTSTRGLWMA